MRSVFGTILDPAADKTLMTTLVITLAWKGLLPRKSYKGLVSCESTHRRFAFFSPISGAHHRTRRWSIVVRFLLPIHLAA